MSIAVQQKTQLIAEIVRMAKSEEELTLLLDDLLTDSEIDKVYDRVRIVSYLMDKLPQRDIAEKIGSGIATVTRGASLMRKPGFVLSKFILKIRAAGWEV